MLVLSRQKDESLLIGDDVKITIVDIRGDKVRLGIEAPGHVPVHREEVYNAIKRETAALLHKQDGIVEGLLQRYRQQNDPPRAFVDWMKISSEPYHFCAVAWTLFKERRRAISRQEVEQRIGGQA